MLPMVRKRMIQMRISRDNVHLFFEHGLNLETRTLYLGYGDQLDYDIDQRLAADVIRGIHLLCRMSQEAPIEILMNCTGGDVTHGLAIYDAIQLSSAPVGITVLGHCHSMAAWILQAGDVRRMTRSSSLMIHNGEGAKYKFDRDQDAYCNSILFNRIREKNPQFPKKKLLSMLDRDTYLWAPQALELGLIDEII